MPLTPSTRLGPYEILAAIGAGGMGEVYRARDTRLGREVAIKVLPGHLSSNPEVRTRFEREAKTISSLNHANICILFDVGREGDTDYLVMELVEGETLAQRLARGALPAADVLKFGAQIADALDRAHRAGVIHRDLKPGNVMITKAGAKLMDFGLARGTGLAGAGGSGLTQGLTHSPTVAAPLTAEGTIVGTFQYMSPEQLEGKEADERSDIWALGCVLYEMATGRRAFEGRSQASLITAIMGTEPPPVSQVAPLAPPGLDRLVKNCLVKDPDERTRTAHDVKLQLQGIAEGVSTVQSSASISAGIPMGGRPARSNGLPWIIAAVSAIAAVVLAVLLMSRPGPQRMPVQLALTPPENAQFTKYSSGTAISPDGRAIAFCAVDSSRALALWVQFLDSPEPTRLAPTVGVANVFWSPDSRSIAFLNLAGGEQKLMVVRIGGGSPVALTTVHGARGGTWSAKGVILYAPVPQGPLFRIPAGGGDPVQATWIDSTRHEEGHRFPCFLPDGEHFLFASLPRVTGGVDIYAGSLGSRSVKRIMTAESAATYAAPGYLVFRRSGKVMAQRFDAGALKLVGDPIVLFDAPPESDMDVEPVGTASVDGRLVVPTGNDPDTRVGWYDATGALLRTLSLPAGKWDRPVLSPDDRYAIIQNGDDLWRVDLARSSAVRITSGGAGGALFSDPVWSPDGTRIAFTMGRQGREEIAIKNSDGSGEAQIVPTPADLFKNPEDWTRDGIVFTDIGAQTFRDVWLAPLPGGGPPRPLVQSSFGESAGRVSPDGRWIAYLSNEGGGGADDAYIQSFPVPGHKVRVSTGGATRLYWMPGSDEIAYKIPSGAIMGAKLTRNGDDLEVGDVKLRFRLPPEVLGSDLSQDGQRVLANFSAAQARQPTLHVILNWAELVKR